MADDDATVGKAQILPADGRKTSAFTIEVEVRETYRVVPIRPMNRDSLIPPRVAELLGALPSYEAAMRAGTMLLALTDVEGLKIDKSFVRAESVTVDGVPMEDAGIPVTHRLDDVLSRGIIGRDSLSERAAAMEAQAR